MRRERLKGTKVEATCLWKAFGERGDVLSSDDPQEATEWTRIERRSRLVPFRRLARTPTDSGDHAPRARAHRARVCCPRPSVSDPDRHGAPAGSQTDPSLARRRRCLAVVASFGTAVALVGAKPDASTNAAATCSGPDLAARWTFQTRVLHAKPTMEYGLDARQLPGHIQGGPGLRLHRRAGQARMGPGWQGDPPPAGAAPCVWIRRGRPHRRRTRRPAPLRWRDATPASISFRFGRYAGWLIGLWRHEGVEFERGGYSGALLGRRADDERAGEEPPHCFFDCVARCHDGLDSSRRGDERVPARVCATHRGLPVLSPRPGTERAGARLAHPKPPTNRPASHGCARGDHVRRRARYWRRFAAGDILGDTRRGAGEAT